MKRDEMFITREELQVLFELTSMQTYEVLKLMDKSHQYRIPFLDLWGALILMALDIGVEEKISGIFNLLDTSEHGWLPVRELRLLIICATRGLSHIKNIHIFTEYLIDKFLRMMMTVAELNEKGEVSLNQVRSYMTMDENSRAYFAALGAETVVLDTGMLVKQRREVLQSIADVQKSIKEIHLQERITEEDQKAYMEERGGDIAALRIKAANVDEQINEVEYVPPTDEWGEPTLEQRARRLARAKARGKGDNELLQDALIYANPNARKKNQSRASAFDENSVTRKWNTLYSHTNDNLKQLDLDLVEDLFEYAGITLTDQVAEEYFNTVRANPLNMRNLQDLLAWYRDRLTTAPPLRGEPPLWRRTGVEWARQLEAFCSQLQGVTDMLNTQKSVVDAMKRKQAFVDRMRQEEEQRQREAEEEAKRLAEEKAKRAAELRERRRMEKLGKVYVPPKAPEPISNREREKKEKERKKKAAKASAVNDIAGELKGNVRLAAWHRQQLTNPTNKIQCNISFGHPELVVPEKAPDAALDNVKNIFKKKKGGALQEQKKQKQKSPYKTKIRLNAGVSVADNKRPPFYDEANGVISNVNFDACDLLAVFTKKTFDREGNAQPDTLYGTVGWIGLTIAKGLTAQEEAILSTCVANFFDSIPSEVRFGAYTAVRTKIFILPGENAGEDSDEEFVDPNAVDARQRVLLVVFLHEIDRFFEFEENLPAGLLISRAVRNIALQMELIPSVAELYQHSKTYEGFEDRLFGPQEDELGEEGMNPIRFAKLQKQRLNAAKEAIAKADTMNADTLKEHLTSRGLSAEGSTRQLIARVRKAFKRQADISGFGELSAFGSDMSARIFRDYWVNKEGWGDPKLQKAEKKKESKSMREKAKEEAEAAERAAQEALEPKGITLWDFNDLLFRTGAQTIYDWKEYKATMESLELLTDKNSNMLGEGLAAYHEHYGGLANDMRNLGIGSLDDIFKGRIDALAAFDGDGIASLMSLMEPHSMLYSPLKYLLTFLMSITDMRFEADYEKVSEMFEVGNNPGFLEFAETLRIPGWLSSTIHSWAQSFADGEEGLLVSLRKGVHECFGRYSRFDEVFLELTSKKDTESTVASTEHEESESVATKSLPEGENVKTVEASEHTAHPEHDREAQARKAALLQAEAKRDEELFSARLVDLLPPKSDGSDYGISTKSLKASVALLNRITEILSDFATFPINREEREGLTSLREEVDLAIKESKRRIEQSKQLSCAHACAAYDAIRMFTDGFSGFGWGTKEVSLRAVLTGLDVTTFLPKGYGEPCIPRQQKQEKMQRAAARKTAALAALEREKLRRTENSEENAERRAAKEAALKLKRSQEEQKLFAEAVDGLMSCRYGGKSTAELATVARIWEKLGSMAASRYPETIKACVHASNVACALKELYSVDHFKGKEAISRLEKAAVLAMTLLQEHSTYPRPDNKLLSKKQREEAEEANMKLNVSIQRKGGNRMAQQDEEENEGDDNSRSSGSSDEEADGGSTNQGQVAVSNLKGPVENIVLPGELVVPLFCVFQNYVSICREAKNNFLLSKMERIKRVIRALRQAMTPQESKPLEERNAMPQFEEIDVLLCGEVKHQMAETLGELQAIEEEEKANADDNSEGSAAQSAAADGEEGSEGKDRADGDSPGKASSSDGSEVRLTADTIERYKRRGIVLPGIAGLKPGQTAGAGPSGSTVVAQLSEEDLLRAERDARKAKRERQRKLDAALRKQTVKQRTKLYHLITSDKISKIFAHKAGHVLAEGAGIRWGNEEDQEEADAFMEESTQATSSDDSSEEDAETKRVNKIQAAKGEKRLQLEQSEREGLIVPDAESQGAKVVGADDQSTATKSGKRKEEGTAESAAAPKAKSFFSFLFRNRDTA